MKREYARIERPHRAPDSQPAPPAPARAVASGPAPAGRPGLTTAVALELIAQVKSHGDEAFAQALEALSRHPDPEVRRQTRAAAATGQPAG